MYTTINEQGILNNYSTEPEVYYSEYPSQEQRSRYAFQGGIATLLVTALVLVACAVS
ncbi:MAG: ssl1498 family light-harvesting-like protein [Calothrix sp. MO_167.B12]|nr:ssl1498 family light-harvesting-like protein [Calothrix sp. MO_167.B12]